MQTEKINSYLNKLASKISDPGYKGESDGKFGILPFRFPIRLIVLAFVMVLFHCINKHPIKIDIVTIAELLYLTASEFQSFHQII
jgi:hypothetical protein